MKQFILPNDILVLLIIGHLCLFNGLLNRLGYLNLLRAIGVFYSGTTKTLSSINFDDCYLWRDGWSIFRWISRRVLEVFIVGYFIREKYAVLFWLYSNNWYNKKYGKRCWQRDSQRCFFRSFIRIIKYQSTAASPKWDVIFWINIFIAPI